MTHPNFDHHGYRVIEPLGQNYLQGRFTYRATNQQGHTVVIKQFQFVTSKDWTGYKNVEREIEVLQALHHPGIPQILETFDPGNGICLVQEYKEAHPLSTLHSLTTDEVKQIAIAALEILVYLQRQVPPVIHRDIKPENVLVDEQLNVYLIDFGLARTSAQPRVALSSQVAGTFGFMAPEQLFNRPLTTATDLYSLGATLICLLSGTPSTEIGTLIDNRFRFRFKPAHLNRQLVQWLQKMVQPELKHRFNEAESALDVLKAIDTLNSPQSQISWLKTTTKAFLQTARLRETLDNVPLWLERSSNILLLWWLVCFAVAVFVAAFGISSWGTITGALTGVTLGALLGSAEEQSGKGALAGAGTGAIGGAVIGTAAKLGASLGSAVGGAVLGLGLASVAIVLAIDLSFEEQLKKHLTSSLLATASGVAVGIGFRAGGYLLLGLLGTVLIASMLVVNKQRSLDPAEVGKSD